MHMVEIINIAIKDYKTVLLFLRNLARTSSGFIQARLKDKFILFKALYNNTTYTLFIDYVTFQPLLPIFVTSIFTYGTHCHSNIFFFNM